MLSLILTTVCAAVIMIAMRMSRDHVKGRFSILAVNYLICSLLGWKYMGFGSVVARGEGAGTTIGLGLLCGVIYVLALMALQYNLPRNGVVLPAVASRVGGLLVPLAMAILFFGEQPRPVQLAGSVLALVSIVALNYDKDHMAAKHVLPLIAIFFADGVATAMAKIFRELGNPAQNDYYLFYIFATAMTMSTVLLLVCRERPGLADLFFGILVGVPNYYAARFLLKALETIPAVVVYPTRGVGGIALVALAGVVLFGERLKRHQWYAMVFVCISVVLLNV